MTSRPIRIGVQLAPQHSTYAVLRDRVREIEDLGADVVFNWDHFYPLSGDPDGLHFESWTMLAAIAEQTLISLGEGTQVAREEGVAMTQISAQEQARFRKLYDRDAERNAAKLARFGIDGRAALAVARASIKPGNHVDCKDKI